MKAYVYQGSLLCEDCGITTRNTLAAPANIADESSYDSDNFPKGPYPNGGGEADGPQACDRCQVFLENPLTEDGLGIATVNAPRAGRRLPARRQERLA